MQVLIDGYNFLHFVERHLELPKMLEHRREWLVKRLHDHATQKNHKVIVVFDGQDQSRDKFGKVEIHYAEGKGSADRQIIDLCERSPGNYLVVSDDREVRSGAKRNSCLDISCEEFFKKFSAPVNPLDEDFPFDKEDSGPIYHRVDTKKKGNPRKLSKAERKRRQNLKKL